MIGIAKTEDDEGRNEFGFPAAQIRGGERSPITADIDQSVNKALPWVAFSWFLSGGAIIGVFLIALLMPALMDSKVSAGVSDAKAAMAQQVADAKASANTARQDARIALDKVEQTQTQLGAKGLIKVETH